MWNCTVVGSNARTSGLMFRSCNAQSNFTGYVNGNFSPRNSWREFRKV